jgi:hypothetical protein
MLRAQDKYEEACRNFVGPLSNNPDHGEPSHQASERARPVNPGNNSKEGQRSHSETTSKLMVNGLEYTQDPHDVGLISIERGLPVLSREYQQDHYITREGGPTKEASGTAPAMPFRPEEPKWAPGCSPIELVCSQIWLASRQNQQIPATKRDHQTTHALPGSQTMASWAAPLPASHQTGAHEAQQLSTTTNQLAQPDEPRPQPHHQPPATPLTQAAGATPTTLQGDTGDYNGPFNGTVCDYASGQHSTCTGTAEVWLKTNKYKQLCRPCAQWAKQQQELSRRYSSSYSDASSSTLPWSTGNETHTPTPQRTEPPIDPPAHQLSQPATAHIGRTLTRDQNDQLSAILAPYMVQGMSNTGNRANIRTGPTPGTRN